MLWAFTTSDGYKGKLNGSIHFLRAFPLLVKTFESYMASTAEEKYPDPEDVWDQVAARRDTEITLDDVDDSWLDRR